MLHSVRLRNFRSFEDTGRIELRKLNVFIGPNNAGKTSLLSAIELFLRSARARGPYGPIAFDQMASFASFNSVLRRHWSPTEQRPHSFTLAYERDIGQKYFVAQEFVCRGRRNDNTSYVARATYRIGKHKLVIKPLSPNPRRPGYAVKSRGRKFKEERLFFHNGLPVIAGRHVPAFDTAFGLDSPFFVEVVHPYRPVPRSFYVLDDPNLSREDRELLAYLVRLWDSDEKQAQSVRSRILETLQTLKLARQFDIKHASNKFGPKVFEIRVAPTIRRHNVTIADAGFGLSQVLPLAAYDARLSDGYFLAYQPEVHLHPYAQSRLADVFTKSVRRGNQVFIESHSPDLILRLQYNIISGDIGAEDVRILCIENRKGRSRLTPIDLTPTGAPEIPWPPGFLDTSLTLARELTSRRLLSKKHAR